MNDRVWSVSRMGVEIHRTSNTFLAGLAVARASRKYGLVDVWDLNTCDAEQDSETGNWIGTDQRTEDEAEFFSCCRQL